MNVDEYLEAAPEPHGSTLRAVRQILRSIVPHATETISYGVPALQVDGKTVAGYAYFENHCSYFPHSGTVLSAFQSDLEGYAWSKGTLKFPVDEPPPASLLEKLVAARLEELGPTS